MALEADDVKATDADVDTDSDVDACRWYCLVAPTLSLMLTTEPGLLKYGLSFNPLIYRSSPTHNFLVKVPEF